MMNEKLQWHEVPHKARWYDVPLLIVVSPLAVAVFLLVVVKGRSA
jgi:hypothetical protein